MKAILLKIWKDPVWSKVIAAGILGLIALITAKASNYSWNEIYSFILSALSYSVPVYFFLSVVAVFYITTEIIRRVRYRKDPFWDEPIGNYTFKDLYNIFLIDTWPVPTLGMAMWGQRAPDNNLMDHFFVYYPILNKGVDFYSNIDDGHYLYGSLAPVFAGFGLVDAYDKEDENLPGKTNVAYKISEAGRKFHAKLNQIGLKEKVKEATAKSKKEHKR